MGYLLETATPHKEAFDSPNKETSASSWVLSSPYELIKDYKHNPDNKVAIKTNNQRDAEDIEQKLVTLFNINLDNTTDKEYLRKAKIAFNEFQNYSTEKNNQASIKERFFSLCSMLPVTTRKKILMNKEPKDFAYAILGLRSAK